jgi:hypothetical protein
LPLIGLLASYCSRRIYQDLQAPVRPVRHACRFLRNRERNERDFRRYKLLGHFEAVTAPQYCPRDSRRFVRQSDRCDTHVTALHHCFDPTTMPVIVTIHEAHHRAGTLHKERPEIGIAYPSAQPVKAVLHG